MNIKARRQAGDRAPARGLPPPAEVLAQNRHLLPASGRALDLASGRGANALCLARRGGLAVSAWDNSAPALATLAFTARQHALHIACQRRDISRRPPAPASFDVIVVSRFLDRGLMTAIKRALRQHGLIFYQTFTKEKVDDRGPRNPAYLLDKNELLGFFKDWSLLYYREEGQTGDLRRGFRNQAMLIAQKP